ncbi:serine hydrolase [Antrihabitans cavernicola]|uniref:Serine hydrolase n=1 Tax=Antrihabitans cavernicola TaxID=2495913 RepID=A0A5A7S6T4_9NOCA|nr:serine hydrolase [Spelaeibacter cavernicola]KAA0020073.1 serine hydrolase [Spelaeibacter cavernicola]
MTTQVEKRIRDVFADAGCTGWLHARRLDSHSAQLSVDGDQLVVTASVYKLPLMVALCRCFDAGEIDPLEQVRVVPAQCTPGPTGISIFRDPVTLSWRDLATSMIVVSDNSAADIVLGRVGLTRVDETIAALGLARTRVVGGTAAVHASLVRETDSHTTAEAFAALADNDDAWTVSAYDPSYASATTPREMNDLLGAIWSGAMLSATQTAYVKDVLGKQLWQHRIRSGFPHGGVEVAGKTGTIGIIRNEVAVVTFPGESPVAVAVFTRAARADPSLPAVDAAIGEVARIAVSELRSGTVDT